MALIDQNDRRVIGRDITRVLDAAQTADIPYRKALGFFSELDWEQIKSGVFSQDDIVKILTEVKLG